MTVSGPAPPALSAARPRLRSWEKLPPFHPVALRLMQILSGDNVSLGEIADTIRGDAVFAAELLRLANSPLFGFKREITSVIQAVGLLGLGRVQALVLTVALRRFAGAPTQTMAAKLCWRHNLACAIVAEDLAVAAMAPADAAYTAGLVHDIGRLALLASDPARLAAILESSEADPRVLCQLERHAFGLDHCDVGAALMEHWHFPKMLQEIAESHHHPLNGARLDMKELIKVACRIADALGFQVAGTASVFDIEGLLGSLPLPARSRLAAGAHEMTAEIATRINSFELCF
jgi:putative nucleotidyltransferase with HDIG domain